MFSKIWIELFLGMCKKPQVARQVLGYKKYNLYGVSYGTHVAQYIVAYYPESSRAIILDGVAPIPFDYLNQIFSISTAPPSFVLFYHPLSVLVL